MLVTTANSARVNPSTIVQRWSLARKLESSVTHSAKVLNNDAAAREMGISGQTLKQWRFEGKGPRFIKLGTSKQSRVVYDPADIEAWKREHKFASTSAYSPAARANRKSDIRRSADASA